MGYRYNDDETQDESAWSDYRLMVEQDTINYIRENINGEI
jgi:hypothetical protein